MKLSDLEEQVDIVVALELRLGALKSRSCSAKRKVPQA